MDAKQLKPETQERIKQGLAKYRGNPVPVYTPETFAKLLFACEKIDAIKTTYMQSCPVGFLEARDAAREAIIAAYPEPPAAPKQVVLPRQDEFKRYRWADGSAVWPSSSNRGKWLAKWADGTPLRGLNERTGEEGKSFFDSAQEAAEAIAAGGEGPAAATV